MKYLFIVFSDQTSDGSNSSKGWLAYLSLIFVCLEGMGRRKAVVINISPTSLESILNYYDLFQEQF